jgi:glycyl-tRNA synthetase beta subunit
MVVEMTSLQGIIGGHYARTNGESEAVAAALAEQYNPVSSTRLASPSPWLPSGQLGLAVGLAPNLNDPFALRRAALGMLESGDQQMPFDVRQAFAEVAKLPRRQRCRDHSGGAQLYAWPHGRHSARARYPCRGGPCYPGRAGRQSVRCEPGRYRSRRGHYGS